MLPPLALPSPLYHAGHRPEGNPPLRFLYASSEESETVGKKKCCDSEKGEGIEVRLDKKRGSTIYVIHSCRSHDRGRVALSAKAT
jgi:hypothetical protein